LFFFFFSVHWILKQVCSNTPKEINRTLGNLPVSFYCWHYSST